MLFLLLIINLCISFYNAKSAGRIWIDAKTIGGIPRLLAWSAAIQSAIGFTSIYLLIILFLGTCIGKIDENVLMYALKYEYLFIILPCLGSGLVITIHSWIVAYRERNWKNIGVAGWNTFAQISNIYDATKTIPDLLGEDLGDTLKSKDKKNGLVLAIIAIALGILTTAAIVKYYAAKEKVKLEKIIN